MKKSVSESVLTEEQQEEFNIAAEPLMRFLEKHCHPHTKVIIDSSKAELLEGIFCSKATTETDNGKIRKALEDIYKLWPEANFKAKTCPEAHLQKIIREIRDIAWESLKA
jgi:hypothetical protein